MVVKIKTKFSRILSSWSGSLGARQKIHQARLKNMLLYRHSAGSTRNVRVKNVFERSFLKKRFFSHKYVIQAVLTLESKVIFIIISYVSFFNCFSCFDFSYPLCSAQVSLDCATLVRQINRWKARAAPSRRKSRNKFSNVN